jgi:hypothetical protein
MTSSRRLTVLDRAILRALSHGPQTIAQLRRRTGRNVSVVQIAKLWSYQPALIQPAPGVVSPRVDEPTSKVGRYWMRTADGMRRAT